MNDPFEQPCAFEKYLDERPLLTEKELEFANEMWLFFNRKHMEAVENPKCRLDLDSNKHHQELLTVILQDILERHLKVCRLTNSEEGEK